MLLLVLLGQQVMAEQWEADQKFDSAWFDAAASKMREEAGAPGMAVAVLRNGQTVLVRGFGIAGPTGAPVTAETPFQIGSITKSFVALIILQMAAEGLLGLDNPLVRHVPTFRTASKSQSDRIIIDHLVTHHSGLTTLDGNRSAAVDSNLSGPAAVVAELAGVQLFAEPGTSFQYSNANYALLSHLIEVLDEQSFEQVLQTRIFSPLGMRNSFVSKPPSGATAVATGYRLWFGLPRAWQPAQEAQPDRRMIGAGGVWASIEDMARYVEAVRTRDPRIVPEGVERLFTVKPIGGHWGYAYGWYADSSADDLVYEHSGFTPGFFTLATIVPARSEVAVVLTNMSGLAHGDLPRAVTNAALGREPVPAAASIGASTAIWWAATAPLGLLLLLFKAARQLRKPGDPISLKIRVLNLGAVLGLVAGAYAVLVGFQEVTKVDFATGYAFFPDLTVTAVVSMVLALLLAVVLLTLVIRGR